MPSFIANMFYAFDINMRQAINLGIFGRGAEYMGYMNTALAVGAIAGTVLLASKKGLAGLEVRVFAGALLFGVCVAGFGMSRSLLLSYVLLLGLGLAQVTVFASSKTMLQSIAARGMHGRIISLYIGLFMGAVTIGGFVIGGSAQVFGAPTALVCGGIGCVLAALYFGEAMAEGLVDMLCSDYHFPTLLNAFVKMVREGTPPWDATAKTSLNAARCLGLDSDLGSIEEGKMADLVCVFEHGDKAVVRDVWVDGARVFSLRNRRMMEQAGHGAKRFETAMDGEA
jgi:hypothetical protein